MAENGIFNNQAMAFMDTGMGLFLWQEMPASVTLAEGETYRVEWNNTEHTCVAFAANFNGVDGIGIGNIALAGLGESTGEHFLFGAGADGSFSACYTDETNATNRMAIYHIAEDDKEYLIWGSTLKGIANAIRSKTGEAGKIAVADMANKISGITGGGSDVEVVYVTFMSHDGTTELYKRAVLPGNHCLCPVAGGLIDTPTKESTAQQNFTFSGSWATTPNGGTDANALNNVTEDRVVYASYIATTRFYTVRFYDGETLLKTMQVEYGASAIYEPEKEGYQFEGWSPGNTNITANTDCYAQWATAITFANATWAQIAEISENGEAANYFKVGDTKTVAYGDDVLTVTIAGFNHDDLADGSGKAGISIVCKTVPNLKLKWNSSYNSSFSYPYSNAHSTSSSTRNSLPRANLNGTVLNSLPADLRSVIKPVTKSYDKSQAKGTASLATCADSLWLLSLDELGHNWGSNFTTSNISALGSKYALFQSMDYTASTTSNQQAVVTVGATATKAHYWTRSLNRYGSSMDYWAPFYVEISGVAASVSFNSGNASYEAYLCFGFCV